MLPKLITLQSNTLIKWIKNVSLSIFINLALIDNIVVKKAFDCGHHVGKLLKTLNVHPNLYTVCSTCPLLCEDNDAVYVIVVFIWFKNNTSADKYPEIERIMVLNILYVKKAVKKSEQVTTHQYRINLLIK